MELSEIYFLGFEVTSSSFEQLMDEPDGQGFYNYDVEMLEEVKLSRIDETEEDDKSEDGEELQFLVKLGFKAKSESYVGEDDPVYSANISGVIRFTFTLPDDGEVDSELKTLQTLLEKEQWFFLNFAHIAAKNGLENLLRYTIGQSSKFPSYR